MSLLNATLKELELHDKTPDDVRYVQTSEFKISWENFIKVSDFEPEDSDDTERMFRSDLVIVGDDWFMEREIDYDWCTDYWVFRQFPKELINTKEIKQKDLLE